MGVFDTLAYGSAPAAARFSNHMTEHRAAGSAFPPTRHSLVAAVRGDDEEARGRAFGALVEVYWRPVYKYLRVKWSASVEDAADLTQEFFTRALEKGFFTSYDPEKALFRTFLRLCVDRFAANEREAARRQKRGGGVRVLPLDFEGAEGELRATDVADRTTPEEFFHREWVRSLFGLAVDDVRARLLADGKATHLALFERYDLGAGGGDRPTYADLAAELGIPATQVTNYLAAARREFRSAVLERLHALSGGEAEYRAEARALLGVEVP
jgi:RNA polymerase sigma factor (sigma-70 family)